MIVQKVTTGFVIHRLRINEKGCEWVSQEFVAGDDVTWERIKDNEVEVLSDYDDCIPTHVLEEYSNEYLEYHMKQPCEMTKVDVVSLPCYGIKLKFNTETGVSTLISSDLGNDAIESMILAHAAAGVDIQSPAYIEGIETAADALDNYLDDIE